MPATDLRGGHRPVARSRSGAGTASASRRMRAIWSSVNRRFRTTSLVAGELLLQCAEGRTIGWQASPERPERSSHPIRQSKSTELQI